MTGPLGPVYRSIDALVAHAQAHLGLDADDAVWARNQVFALYGLDSYGADDADADVAPAGAPGTWTGWSGRSSTRPRPPD